MIYVLHCDFLVCDLEVSWLRGRVCMDYVNPRCVISVLFSWVRCFFGVGLRCTVISASVSGVGGFGGLGSCLGL